MGRVFLVELEGRSYRCRFCNNNIALADDVLSRSFNCRRGKAYLFSNVVNVTAGPKEERLMLSGMHTVEDVFCCCCGQILGWKYVCEGSIVPEIYKSKKCNVADLNTGLIEIEHSLGWGLSFVSFLLADGAHQVTTHDKYQKYKEGKFVLERWRIVEEGIKDLNVDANPGSSDLENP